MLPGLFGLSFHAAASFRSNYPDGGLFFSIPRNLTTDPFTGSGKRAEGKLLVRSGLAKAYGSRDRNKLPDFPAPRAPYPRFRIRSSVVPGLNRLIFMRAPQFLEKII